MICSNEISTHALREEGDRRISRYERQVRGISTHALREEGDCRSRSTIWSGRRFLPTPSARRATGADGRRIQRVPFLPTPSARRATHDRDVTAEGNPKFLPTPSARRATGGLEFAKLRKRYFYPRPPRGGRRPDFQLDSGFKIYFYPRPPRGGRQGGRLNDGTLHRISTHALREEGDPPIFGRANRLRDFYPRPPRGGRRTNTCRRLWRIRFLPTPSARRATSVCHYSGGFRPISTHALREEGDGV